MSGGGAKALAIRVIITTAALVIWFWTQSLIGARPAPANGIGDGPSADGRIMVRPAGPNG